jgi:PAS domain S-box-containing protein
MLEFFAKFFSADGFMPHGHCYLWRPGVLWLHIVSDAFIALAYFSIPFTLVYFVRKRRDLEFNWMFVCFAVFIVACGTTHLMEILVIWHPVYWLSGCVKALTALASVPTAVLLLKLVPGALRLPSPAALRQANLELQTEVGERRRAERELRRLADELEQRVTERTQQAEAVNRDLHQALLEREEAGKSLRESEHLLRQVIDLVPHLIFAKDQQSRHLFVNRACAQANGLTPEQMVGLSDEEIVRDREQAEAFMRDDREVIASGRQKIIEENLTDCTGQTRLLHTIKMPFSRGATSQPALLGVAVDITELKRAESAVKQKQQLLQAIIDNSAAMIYVKDLQGRYLMVNRRFTEVFHFEQEAISGKTDHDLFPKENADAFRAMDERVAAARTALTEEEAAPHDDGLHTYVSVKCPLHDSAGQPYAVFGISTDITERKEADQRLRSQLARLDLLSRTTRAIGERQDLRSIFQVVLRSLEDNLPIDFGCVCLWEPPEQFLTVMSVGAKSESLAKELGMLDHAHIPIDEDGLSRCVCGELVYDPDITLNQFPFTQRLARGGLASLVIAPLLVESQVFGVVITARRQASSFSSSDCEFLRQLSEQVALAAHQAQLHGALQEAYDELRQTQQAVMQQERLRALGQMASGIAHDINNALSPVVLYTESLLERESSLTARGREKLEIIQRAVGDVAQTVSRMKEVNRQREPQLTLVPLDLNDLVEQVAELTRARWSDMPQQRGILIELRRELHPQLPAVMGVDSEIREALINLIFNAVDAMPGGGTLTLVTKSLDVAPNARDVPLRRHAELAVTDTGIGMDVETQRRCLEPFFTTKGERGTGLGLAMVHGVVQRHGAEIQIETEPGKGTTVRIIFPTPPSPNKPASAASEEPDDRPPRARLLIIDDDPVLLGSLREVLEADGHAVTAAKGGQEGIDSFRAAHESGKSFNLVITDLGMPVVDGAKVAASVKEISSSTPVLLLTGWGLRLMAQGDLPADVDQVISKPPKLSELRTALARALAPRTCPAKRFGNEQRYA